MPTSRSLDKFVTEYQSLRDEMQKIRGELDDFNNFLTEKFKSFGKLFHKVNLGLEKKSSNSSLSDST